MAAAAIEAELLKANRALERAREGMKLAQALPAPDDEDLVQALGAVASGVSYSQMTVERCRVLSENAQGALGVEALMVCGAAAGAAACLADAASSLLSSWLRRSRPGGAS